MKTARLQPLSSNFRDIDELKKNQDYFVSSFYKTVDKTLILHTKKNHSYNNTSLKSLNFPLKHNQKLNKSTERNVKLQSLQTREVLQFYSKNNKLNVLFNDPITKKSLNDKFEYYQHSDKITKNNKNTDIDNVVFKRRFSKSSLAKTKPARFSLNLSSKHSENFQSLLNKFHCNIKPETPQTNYLQDKLHHFMKKTRFLSKKQENARRSTDVDKFEGLFKKFQFFEKMDKDQQLISLKEMDELIKSQKEEGNNQKILNFDLEKLEEDYNARQKIFTTPIKNDIIQTVFTGKQAVKEMLFKKKQEIFRLSAKNLKIDLKCVNAVKDEIEDMFENSPLLLSCQKKLVETHRPVMKRSKSKVRKALKEALQYLSALNLTVKDIMSNCVFSKKPYQKQGSYEFIKATKRGDLVTITKMFEVNRFWIFDFDDVYMTPLHWATRRGHLDCAIFLLKCGSDINAKDIVGRTPLYIAIQCERVEILKVLLFFKANPWSSLSLNYNRVLKPNSLCSKLLTKARKLHILMKMTPLTLRLSLWQRESWLLFLEGGNDDLFKKLNGKEVEES